MGFNRSLTFVLVLGGCSGLLGPGAYHPADASGPMDATGDGAGDVVLDRVLPELAGAMDGGGDLDGAVDVLGFDGSGGFDQALPDLGAADVGELPEVQGVDGSADGGELVADVRDVGELPDVVVCGSPVGRSCWVSGDRAPCCAAGLVCVTVGTSGLGACCGGSGATCATDSDCCGVRRCLEGMCQ